MKRELKKPRFQQYYMCNVPHLSHHPLMALHCSLFKHREGDAVDGLGRSGCRERNGGSRSGQIPDTYANGTERLMDVRIPGALCRLCGTGWTSFLYPYQAAQSLHESGIWILRWTRKHDRVCFSTALTIHCMRGRMMQDGECGPNGAGSVCFVTLSTPPSCDSLSEWIGCLCAISHVYLSSHIQ